MDCSLIFVSAKLCYTASQLVFDFDFDPIQNFVPQSQIDIPIFCLCLSVLSLQNKLFFCVFHASAKRETANKKLVLQANVFFEYVVMSCKTHLLWLY